MRKILGSLVLALSLAISTPVLAHGDNLPETSSHGPVMSPDQVYQAFGWDFDKASDRWKLRHRLYGGL